MEPVSVHEERNATNKNNTSATMELTYELVRRSVDEVVLSDQYPDVTLVLGGTGSGKTTLTQWIAGDDRRLMSKEIECGEFLIYDDVDVHGEPLDQELHTRIGHSNVDAKTIFPELVVNRLSNSALYDCPGFDDTRGVSYDLAASHFIKKVADFSNSIKIIFVIKHQSVRKGVDREDFMKLMKHATDLAKDIAKYRNSIAIVVTKVDNIFKREGNSRVLVDDESVISSVANYLMQVKIELEKKLDNQPCAEQYLYENAKRIIDILLMKKNECFTRIGIFRRPDEAGLLCESASFREQKTNIRRIMFTELSFANQTPNDFGYGLSEKSMNDIHKIVESIDLKQASIFREISETLKLNFYNLVENIYRKIDVFLTPTPVVDADNTEAQNFVSSLRDTFCIIKNIVEKINSCENMEDVILAISCYVSPLDIVVPTSTIIREIKYLKFLESLSGKKLKLKSWAEIFINTLMHFKEMEDNLQIKVTETFQIIKNRTENILNSLKDSITKNYDEIKKTFDVQDLLNKIRQDKAVLNEQIESIRNQTMTSNVIQVFSNIQISFGIDIPGNYLQDISQLNGILSYLQILNNSPISLGSLSLSPTLEDINNHLTKSETWYKFLLNLYEKLSEYEIQKDPFGYVELFYDIQNNENLENIADLKITLQKWKMFMDTIEEHSLPDCHYVRSISPSLLHLEELNLCLDLTLKHNRTKSLTDSSVTIQGDFICSKSIVGDLSYNSDLKLVEVFATNTIFIDEDISVVGKELTLVLISPRLETIGGKIIDLSGNDGEDPTTKYADSSTASDRARPGVPGNPGGRGGIFFGIVKDFISCENLKILVNGGKGGPGQKGENGKNADILKPLLKMGVTAVAAAGTVGVAATASGTAGATIAEAAGATIAEAAGATAAGAAGATAAGAAGATAAGASRAAMTVFKNALALAANFTATATAALTTFGDKGHHGGHGGKGGIGGNSGYVNLLELGSTSGITLCKYQGRDGNNGRGGIGGTDGGLTLINTAGENGNDGENKDDQLHPVNPLSFRGHEKVVNKFKMLRPITSNRFNTHSLLHFLDLIDANQQKINALDTSANNV